MLKDRELVKRINYWTKKPKAKVPICYHNSSHGRLKAIQLKGSIVLSCTKCSFKLMPWDLPKSAFRKAA